MAPPIWPHYEDWRCLGNQGRFTQLPGWEAKDRFYSGNHPFLCDCGARFLIAETSVSQAFDSAEIVDGDAGFDRQADGLCQSMLLRRLQRQRLQAPIFAGACVKQCCEHPKAPAPL